MLRVEGSIRAANQYEEPRPPRRGSHKPEVHALNAALPRNPPMVFVLHQHSNQPDPVLLVTDRFSRPTYHHRRSETSPQHSSLSSSTASISKASPPRKRKEREFIQDPTDSWKPTTLSKTAADLIKQLHARARSAPINSQSALEQYTRTVPLSASCQSIQKRCMHANCTKISVSRGLCRGHGGGRRCQMPACTKSAQSRSNFCWAHGGGQRCDVEGCMRSRKSKRFCVGHMQLELEPTSSELQAAGTTHTSPAPVSHHRHLPSIGQALHSALRSAPNLPVLTQQLV